MTRTSRLKVWTAMLAAMAAAMIVLAVALMMTPHPASARSSDHGASFAVRCDFSHRNLDDPIRYPGIEGNLDDPDHDFHSHDFFGNETTKFDSTYESLRAADTTCTRPKDTAAYWLPTVSWDGEVLNSNR